MSAQACQTAAVVTQTCKRSEHTCLPIVRSVEAGLPNVGSITCNDVPIALIYHINLSLHTLLSVSCELVLNLTHAPSKVYLGHLLKLKCAHLPLNLRILSSISVPFTIPTVQVPNIALTHTKWITVHLVRVCKNIHIFSTVFIIRKYRRGGMRY
jgi:hypothetical protein